MTRICIIKKNDQKHSSTNGERKTVVGFFCHIQDVLISQKIQDYWIIEPQLHNICRRLPDMFLKDKVLSYNGYLRYNFFLFRKLVAFPWIYLLCCRNTGFPIKEARHPLFKLIFSSFFIILSSSLIRPVTFFHFEKLASLLYMGTPVAQTILFIYFLITDQKIRSKLQSFTI